MNGRYIFGSLARISDLAERPFEVELASRAEWATGDYVVGEVLPSSGPLLRVELPTGRLMDVSEGDLIVGAFGVRRATLETVGDWESIAEDGLMHSLTGAGLFGRITGRSHFLPPPMPLRYRGHVVRAGKRVTMADFAVPETGAAYDRPTILIIGTSMSSGKTTTARILVRQLRAAGHEVVGAKVTGAARYRDILAMSDAGARAVFDFVDAGLPSSVGPPDTYRSALRRLLGRIQREAPDIVVAEAGASPLEPYNGQVAMDELRPHVCYTVLCASDPYAVVGVVQGFGFEPDLVTGVAAATPAGIELTERLSGVETLELFHPANVRTLMERLEEAL